MNFGGTGTAIFRSTCWKGALDMATGCTTGEMATGGAGGGGGGADCGGGAEYAG